MDLVRWYQAWFVRRMTPRVGEERAHREGPASAVLVLALLSWTAVVALASLAREAGAPELAIALYLVAIGMAPFVFVAWRRLSRIRRPESDDAKTPPRARAE